MLPKRRRLVIAGVVVTVAAFLVVVLAPVPQHFTMHGAAIYDLSSACPRIDTTPGTTFTFHWSAPSPIYFFVVSCSANDVTYHGNGTQGSGTFVPVGGVYEFGASCPEGPCMAAAVSGTYTGPLLALWFI